MIRSSELKCYARVITHVEPAMRVSVPLHIQLDLISTQFALRIGSEKCGRVCHKAAQLSAIIF